MIDWHVLDKKEALKKLKSNVNGLSKNEVSLRLKKHGLNKLKQIHKINPFAIFLKQFASVLVYILVAAAIVSALIGHWLDFWVIFAIIFLNSCFGFVQEYKAERTIQSLKRLLVPNVKVMRQDKLEKIDAANIVPGDILILDEGDKIMADARLLDTRDLQVNEAVLTGESLPLSKHTEAIKIDTVLAERTNMVYTGTSVVRGNARAVVVATGMLTEFGRIASLVQKVKPEQTPLQKKLNTFSKQLGVLILILSAIISLIGISFGLDKIQMFLTGVSLAVSAIPEGLPAVITLCLAIAIQRMRKNNSLIRKLPAAETLGRTTVICVDKTGTLTAEEMAVKQLYCNNKTIYVVDKNNEKTKFLMNNKIINPKDKPEINLLLKIGCLCNNARIETVGDKEEVFGDPTEKALAIVAKKASFDKKKLTEQEPRIKEFAFTSTRKLMSIIREVKGKKLSYVKGAPDIILERCSSEFVNGRIINLTKQRKQELIQQYERMSSEALRVLACAFKQIPKYALTQNIAEYGLTFVGFQGMIDPPRPEVKHAISQCKNAGIHILMITGDSALTAQAIAKEINLTGDIMTAIELDKISDEELATKIKDIGIFARLSPKHKLRIVDCLKKNKEVVAVTGDGVNDVLALKRADIGVAMGIRGTDVARDVSDIVLLDDDFATIVKAVKEGRRSYDNVKKFIKYLLSANAGEILIIFFSIIARIPLPLLPLQILWINLVTDSIPALALGNEHTEKDVMQRKPNPKEEILKGMLSFIVIAGLLGCLATLLIFIISLPSNYSSLTGTAFEEAMRYPRTMALTTIVIFELLFVFVCRSSRKIKEIGFFSNKFLIWAVFAAAALHVIAIYTPLSIAFKLVPLGLFDWLKVIALGSIGLIFFEAKKYIKKKR